MNINKFYVTLLSIAALTIPAVGALTATSQTEIKKPQPIAKLEVFASTSATMPRVLKSNAVNQAAVSVPEEYRGRKFYGSIPYSDFIEYPTYGLYEFTISSTTISHKAVVTMMSADWICATRQGNYFYGARPVSLFGKLTDVAYEKIDIAAKKVVSTKFVGGSFANLPAIMTTDFTDGKIYAIMYNADLTGLNMATFDPEEMVFTVTGKFGGKFNPLTLAVAPNGKLYTISPDGDLYTVNKNTGRVTLVDNTGVNVAAYNQSMTWDSKTNTFFWPAVTATGTKLYALNPETAKAKFIMTIPSQTQVAGVYLTDDAVPAAGAPTAISDLGVDWASAGSLQGSVSFTVPAKNAEGAAIQDNLSINMWIDGEQIKEDYSAAPGSKVTVPYEFTNELHQIAVTAKDADGAYAPIAQISRWAGYDSPDTVCNLTYTVVDRTATITWSAPKGPAHGGYLNPANVTYNVWRFPDTVKVAEGIAETTFTDQLPQTVRQYFYRVEPVNTDVPSKPGKMATSNVLVAGEAYTVPYYEDWHNYKADKSDKLFAVIDGDKDSNTWRFFDWNPNWNCNNPNGIGRNDDWFISPKVALEAGNIYRFKANLRNSFISGPEEIKIAFGQSVTDVTGFTVVGTWELTSAKDENREVIFEVPATGHYNMAVVNTTEKGKGSSTLLNSIGVELVGRATAPGAVVGLVVTPDSGKEKKATLTFTTPSKTLHDEDLPERITVKIYRDADLTNPVATLTAAPATEQTWTDEAVPTAGYHTYTVICENADGAGLPAKMKKFIGIYEAPFFDGCNTLARLDEYTFLTVNAKYDEQYPPLRFNTPVNDTPSLGLLQFNQNDADKQPMELYVAMPEMRLADETVYKLSLDVNNMTTYGYKDRFELRSGSEPTVESLTKVEGQLPKSTNYKFATVDYTIVNTKQADRVFAIYVRSETKNDYVMFDFRNVSLIYEASALAPDSVTSLACASDLSANISFKAPTVDYAGRPITKLTKIEVFRQGTPYPIHTIENVAPGELVKWTDEGAILGNNNYTVIPYNEHDHGRPSSIKAFIGYDVPAVPENVGITPTDDNQSARINWSTVKRGVNGGVISDDLTFDVVRLDGNSAGGTDTVLIKSGITETVYDLERTPTERQALEFYGVRAVTPHGKSGIGMYYTILGKPYAVPFAESFPKGEPKSGLWIGMHSPGALQSGPTASEGMAQYSAAPYDGDGGAFFLLNGTMMDIQASVPVLTPKVTLADATDPYLTFWLYKGNQSGSYANNPALAVAASYNEGDFEMLGTIEWNETKPGWKQYSYSLNKWKGMPGNLIFNLTAMLNGYLDIIFMDDFRVTAKNPASVDGIDDDTSIGVVGISGAILTRGAIGSTVKVYTPDGRIAATFTATDTPEPIAPGVYVVSIAGRSFKVAVK